MRPIILPNGDQWNFPVSDPIVAAHIEKESSYVGTLLHQINVEKTYYPLFHPKRDLTFLDIGANIGLVSIYASPVCSRIIAVEPAPETFSVLHAMTHKLPNIELFCGALAPTDGQCEFHLNDLNTTASSTVNTYGTLTTVRGFTLNSLLRIHQLEHVDVVKCDSEGPEADALSYEELKEAAPIVDAYYCEVHNTPKVIWEETLGRLVRDFARLGYHRQQINGMALIARK
jgi:FkbM family methyltransferase